MAERIGYYSPETAKLVLQVVQELVRQGYVTKAGAKKDVRWYPKQGIIAYTPAGGIAARSGTTAGSATCQVYRLDESGILTAVTDNAGDDVYLTVYHIGSTAVTGNAYIQAKWVSGQWVADMEDCT